MGARRAASVSTGIDAIAAPKFLSISGGTTIFNVVAVQFSFLIFRFISSKSFGIFWARTQIHYACSDMRVPREVVMPYVRLAAPSY